MAKENYKLALDTAREELQQVLNKQNELQRRATELKRTIEALSSLCEENPETNDAALEALEQMLLPELGITTGIRTILQEADRNGIIPNATDIRDALIEKKFDLSGYANALAVIHNTLNRLERQGEIEPRLTGWALTEKGKGVSLLSMLEPNPALAGLATPHKRRPSNRNPYRPGSRLYLQFEQKRREELEETLREPILTDKKK